MDAYQALMVSVADLRDNMKCLADPYLSWSTYRKAVLSELKKLNMWEAAVMEEGPIRLPCPEVEAVRREAAELLRATEKPRETPSHRPMSFPVSLGLYDDIRLKANSMAAHFTGRPNDKVTPEELAHAVLAVFARQDIYADEITLKRDDLVKFVDEQREAAKKGQ